MDKLLSICIPTFNRGDLLAIQLQRLSDQIEKLNINENLIEILISDNNSSDNTSNKIQHFTKKKYIRYFFNKENIGPDANFLQLFQIAQGDYIWLLGDDDLFSSDIIDYLISKLSSKEIDYLYLKAGKGLHKSQINFVNSHEDFLKTVTIFSTFMSSQVIKRTLLTARLDEAHAYLGGFMAYYFLFVDAIRNSSIISISAKRKIFPGSTNNTGGYGFFTVWSKSVFDVLKEVEFADPYLFDLMRADMFWKLLLPIYIKTKLNDTKRFELEDSKEPLGNYFADRIKVFAFLSAKRNNLTLRILLLGINLLNLRYIFIRRF